METIIPTPNTTYFVYLFWGKTVCLVGINHEIIGIWGLVYSNDALTFQQLYLSLWYSSVYFSWTITTMMDKNEWLMTGCTEMKMYIKYITRQIWGIWKLRPAYSPETPNSGQKRWCFVPCDLEIWWMTLENNRAPLLCCFKLCATFHNHQWIQTGVAVQKRPISVKFDDF